MKTDGWAVASRMRGHRPATKERMETADGESTKLAQFHHRANKDKKPFFVWFNSTRMHIFTHLKPSLWARPGCGQADGMVEHDGQVGQLWRSSTLGIADNTIVIYTTDNGAESFSWPDGGDDAVPQREEQQLGGGYRVPACGALAGCRKAAHRDQRHLLVRGLGSDLYGRGR